MLDKPKKQELETTRTYMHKLQNVKQYDQYHQNVAEVTPWSRQAIIDSKPQKRNDGIRLSRFPTGNGREYKQTSIDTAQTTDDISPDIVADARKKNKARYKYD